MQPMFIFGSVMARVAADDINRAADTFGMRGTLATIWWAPARDGLRVVNDMTERTLRLWGRGDLADSFHQMSDITRRPFDMLAGDVEPPQPEKLERDA